MRAARLNITVPYEVRQKMAELDAMTSYLHYNWSAIASEALAKVVFSPIPLPLDDAEHRNEADCRP